MKTMLNKPLSVIILLLLCSMVTSACSGDDDDIVTPYFNVVENHPLPENVDTLRVLMIGNSYAEDCARYINEIVDDVNLTQKRFCIYVASQSGASLEVWWRHMYYNDKVELVLKAGQYQMKSVGSLTALFAQPWDVIVFQQNSDNSIDFNTYNPFLYKMLTVAREVCTNPRMAFAWNLTWRHWYGYDNIDQQTASGKFDAICAASQNVMTLNGINNIIPLGTAVENARHSAIQTDFDLTRDGTHLCFGIGNYIVAGTFFQTIFKPAFNIDITESTLVHEMKSYEINATKYKLDTSVNDSNRGLCHKCILLASQNKFAVSLP